MHVRILQPARACNIDLSQRSHPSTQSKCFTTHITFLIDNKQQYGNVSPVQFANSGSSLPQNRQFKDRLSSPQVKF